MTAPVSRINPEPVVILGGTTLGIRRAATKASTVAVLDDLSVTWGRSLLTEHHAAQTGRFRLYVGRDNISWARTDYRNRTVQMQWSDARVQATPVIFFRGRVTEQAVTPLPPDPRDGRFRGAVVEFTCTGRLTELANRRTGVEDWPEEWGRDRLARIRALAGSSISSITMREYWAGAPFAARRVNNTDALSLLQALYDTSGADRMTYDPQTDSIAWIGRRNGYPTNVSRARLVTDPTTGLVTPRAMKPGANQPMISARECESSGELRTPAGAGITRVEYSWTEAGNVQRSGVIYDPTGEANRGVLQLSLSTELRQGDWALQCAGDWLDMLWEEGGRPQPPAMTYRADKVGGFLNTTTALQLIGGREMGGTNTAEPSIFWIGATSWGKLGYPPIVGPIGGVIRYAGGGWQPTFYSQAIYTLAPGESLKVRDAVADSTRTRFPIRKLARGVTFADLRDVGPWPTT